MAVASRGPLPGATARRDRWVATNWRTKLLLLLLAFSIVPLVVQGMWDSRELRRSHELAIGEALGGIARSRSVALEHLVEDRRQQVERIASLLAPRVEALEAAAEAGVVPAPPVNLPALRDAEALPATGASADEGSPPHAPRTQPQGVDTAAPLREQLALILWDQRQFEELLVLDSEGRVLASTFVEHEQQDASGLEYFRAGRAATFMQPVFLSPITNELTMVISTPLRDARARPLGVLAARLNLESVFEMVTDTTGLGETGEVVAARRDGERLVWVAPTRHDPEAALRRSIEMGRPESAAVQRAALGEAGHGRSLDYRGNEVIAAWQHVPALDWGLVVKMDSAEALAPAARARARMFTLVVLLGAGIAMTSVLAARALVQPLVDLREAAEKISRGDFDVQLDIRSRDEIGQLANSFERMVAAIRFFRAEARGEREDEDDAEARG
jgi:HAMP domain-containing protein